MWNELLVCEVESIEYDFRTRTGRLLMPRQNCCDMDGCIEFFKQIDPLVEVIYTQSDGIRDTSYRKQHGMWCAGRSVWKAS